jgi:hypothetical protein
VLVEELGDLVSKQRGQKKSLAIWSPSSAARMFSICRLPSVEVYSSGLIAGLSMVTGKKGGSASGAGKRRTRFGTSMTLMRQLAVGFGE